jgi:hypothetical protein
LTLSVWLEITLHVQLAMDNCSFSSNHANECAAVAAWNNASVIISASSIQSNTAAEQGGGLCFLGNSTGNLTQLWVTDNSAGANGGGMSLDTSAQVHNDTILTHQT